jgi:hypothetical protein
MTKASSCTCRSTAAFVIAPSLLMVVFALCAALFLAATASAACPNEAIRAAQTSEALPNGTVGLPACMALELADPPKKYGQETGEAAAFSADGERLQFHSKAALGDTPGLQSFGGDNYVAIRGSGGWTTAPTSPPAAERILVAGIPHAFSADLGSWVSFGATQSQGYAAEGHLFKGALGGAYERLSPLLVSIDDSGNQVLQSSGYNFNTAGTAADLSLTVFRTYLNTTSFLPGDPRGIGGDNADYYVATLDSAGEPSLELLARDKAGKVWGGRCGAHLGGGFLNQGAISPDGSRIFLSARPNQPFDETKVGNPEGNPACSTANPLRILERSATPAGPEVTELLPGGPSAPGDDLYQGASLDGTKVFLTTPRALSGSDEDTGSSCSSDLGASKGCDLYLYDSSKPVAERLTQISAGGTGDPTPGKDADVLSSVTSISPDGSHVYFVAQGVLTTTANPAGAAAQLGKPNLYLYERDAANPTGRTAFIGSLAPGDKEGLWGVNKSFVGNAYAVPLLGGGEEGGGDGHILFLDSKATLTSEDLDGGHLDVYRYDSEAGTLQCVTCGSGEANSGPFDALVNPNPDNPPSSNFAEKGRWVSEDGQTVAFATNAPLEEGDEDGLRNPYLWHEGQLAKLPADVPQFQQNPIVSPSGAEVGFTTSERLLPVDGDGARDAYVVRSDGGFPNPVAPPPCNPLSEGACQGPASVAAAVSTAATSSFSGPGNQGQAPKCRRGQVRKRGGCVKAHKKQQQKKQKRASHKRGGSR